MAEKPQKKPSAPEAPEVSEPSESEMKVTTTQDIGEPNNALAASGDAWIRTTIETSLGSANYEFKVVRHSDQVNQEPALLADIMFKSLRKFFPEIKR